MFKISKFIRASLLLLLLPTSVATESPIIVGSIRQVLVQTLTAPDNPLPDFGRCAQRLPTRTAMITYPLPFARLLSQEQRTLATIDKATSPRSLVAEITDTASLQTAVAAWCTDPAAATTTYGDISGWDTSAVTDMYELFYTYCSTKSTFNDAIGAWDVASVTTLAFTFWAAYAYNQPLDAWHVASVTTLQATFKHAWVFNQALDSWVVSSVTSLRSTFESAVCLQSTIGLVGCVERAHNGLHGQVFCARL